MFEYGIMLYDALRFEQRIGYILEIKDNSDYSKFINYFEYLQTSLDDLNVSTHFLSIDSKDINCIEKKDPYFKGIKYITDIDDFKNEIEEDRQLEPIDIVKNILSKKSMSQLYLQDFIFFVYREALKQGLGHIFKEDFYKLKHGPVIKDLQKYLAKFKNNEISTLDNQEAIINRKRISRINQGDKILNVIDTVLNEYEGKTNQYIYKKAHIEGGAWDLTKDNKKIEKELISHLAYYK